MFRNSNNRRSRRDQSKSQKSIFLESRQLNMLEQLVEYNKTQINGFVPRVQDVPRMVLKRDKVHSFARVNISLGQILNSITTPVGFANAQSLSGLPNAADFINLFEQYRIIQATWLFTPLFNGLGNPLYTWFDPDDATVPIGTAEGAQSETLMISRVGQFVERTYTPQLSQDGLAQGGALTGYSAPPPTTWVDEQSSGALYYGIKAVVPANTNIGNNVPLFDVTCSVIIQCRRPK